MENSKPRIGKKGGAKRVAQELTKIRKTPLTAYFGDFDRVFRSKPTGSRSVATLAV